MRWLKRWKTPIPPLVAVTGPGWMTANADNDAKGIMAPSCARTPFQHFPCNTVLLLKFVLVGAQALTLAQARVVAEAVILAKERSARVGAGASR